MFFNKVKVMFRDMLYLEL